MGLHRGYIGTIGYILKGTSGVLGVKTGVL